MFATDLFRTVATLACTALFSITAVAAAVGPAQQAVADTTVAAPATLTA